jgi:hypothetical protein
MPSRRGQQRYHDDGEDACASTATTVCEVAIFVDFVARRAVAIVIDVVAIIVKVVARRAIAIVANFVVRPVVIVVVSVVSQRCSKGTTSPANRAKISLRVLFRG